MMRPTVGEKKIKHGGDNPVHYFIKGNVFRQSTSLRNVDV